MVGAMALLFMVLQRLNKCVQKRKRIRLGCEARERFDARVTPLGKVLCVVFWCLDHNGQLRRQFESEVGDVHVLAKRMLEELLERCMPLPTTEGLHGSTIVAAGLVMFGRLDMVAYVLATLPPERLALDHGCGKCNVVAMWALATVLPLPENLRDTTEWFEGSRARPEVRRWFAEHEKDLRWDEVARRFVLQGEAGSAV
jgi:hypothetical protein